MDWWVNNPVFTSPYQDNRLQAEVDSIEQRLNRLETAAKQAAVISDLWQV